MPRKKDDTATHKKGDTAQTKKKPPAGRRAAAKAKPKTSAPEKGRFTCPYCLEIFDTIDELKRDILENHRGEALPLSPGQIRITVNGDEHLLQVEPQWTLYYLIHDVLGLTGSKQFCDRGACGSCTVIADGRAVLSCMMLAVECDGMNVETVEGVAKKNHPLIESYTNHHAMQCGYCTPGFVVTAKALLDSNPDPTEEDIRAALAGNLCRCGTYPQHPKAVKEAAERCRCASGNEEGTK